MADLGAVEARLRALLAPYRGDLVEAPIYGLTVLRRTPENVVPAKETATVAATNGLNGLSPADKADDELLRSVDSVLSSEAPNEALLPEAMK